MIDGNSPKKVALNGKIFVIKVAKYKQSCIVAPYKILNHYNGTQCQEATEKGDITGHQN
jgi:hypothetical protein